jgi:type I restriction enzyme S subunit
MKTYEKYKSTNINWIGKIPNHWTVDRLKYNSNIEYGFPFPSEQIVSSEMEYAVIRIGNVTSGEVDVFFSEDINSEIPIVINGDLILSMTGDFNCRIWKNVKAVLNQRCAKINPTVDEGKRFLSYAIPFSLREIEATKYFTTHKNLGNEELKNLFLPTPPVTEQVAIANYLDKKTVEVDTLISQKEKLIEILKEERIAKTNTAVTKGLNAKVNMKPSGVVWIGDIPEHWKVTRVKYVCTVQGRIGFKGYKSSDLVMEGEGALVLGATHITRDHKIDITEPVFLSWEKYYESPEIMVNQGDVVFTQRGVYLGKVALIDRDYKDVTINPSLILLKENLINSGYLTFYLTSHYIRKTIELISSNTAIPMISQENLSNFYCLVPPEKEQEEIFDFVNKSNTKIDLTISQI